MIVLKDLNFLQKSKEKKLCMNFTADDRKKLLEIVWKDTDWLSKKRLLDYSLLIGVEKIDTNVDDIENNPVRKLKKSKADL